MTVRQSPDLPVTKIDILKPQLDYSYALRAHHTQWMNETDEEDYEIYRLHREIVDLIRPVTHRFQTLLEELQENTKQVLPGISG